jgi:hypothetical protein
VAPVPRRQLPPGFCPAPARSHASLSPPQDAVVFP